MNKKMSGFYANGHQLGHIEHELIKYDEISTNDRSWLYVEPVKRKDEYDQWCMSIGLTGRNCYGFIDEPSQHQIHKEKAGMIKKVIFNGPCTIVLWNDGTKTVVRSQEGDIYDKEKGLAMAFAKKLFGNTSYYYDIFREHIQEEDDAE